MKVVAESPDSALFRSLPFRYRPDVKIFSDITGRWRTIMNQGLGRPLASLLLGLVCLLATGVCGRASDDTFDPYSVYVDQEEVTARCGPGGEYYRTDPLRHGQRLEVYIETDDGWLGIRPPEGSFCWVPAESIRLDRGGRAGRVTEDGTLAWIGTHLGKARKYMWQVQLAQDEEVVVLGKSEREGPNGPQQWYRIAAPAGEFRWVHRQQVVDNPELLLRNRPRPDQRLADAMPTPVDDVEAIERPRSRPGFLAAAKSILQTGSIDNPEPARPIVGTDAPPEDIRLYAFNDSSAIPLSGEHPNVTISPLPNMAATDESPNGYPEPVIRAGFAASESQTAEAVPADARVASATAERSPAAIVPEQNEPLTGASPTTTQPSDSSPIGSGVARAFEPPLVTITSSPMVRPIGSIDPHESVVRTASDANWVRGTGRSPNVNREAEQKRFDRASVDELQIELSRRMSASPADAQPTADDLEPLKHAANGIANGGGDDSDRQRARMLLQRIEQYQSILRRRQGQPVGGSLPTAPSPSAELAGFSATNPPLPITTSSNGEPSSATEVGGFLVQVYSARPDSPPFALTDSTGRTTHYVSPAPGVNLRRYLNQYIRVGGAAGYETGLDTPHIIAATAHRAPELR